MEPDPPATLRGLVWLRNVTQQFLIYYYPISNVGGTNAAVQLNAGASKSILSCRKVVRATETTKEGTDC